MNYPDNLYAQVVAITEEYLGPAAERFVERQVIYHLGKAPDQLAPSDLAVFSQWAKLSLGLLTEDQAIIHEYIKKITDLNHVKDMKN